MVEVGGKPILWYQVEQLKRAGVTQIIFACSYKKEVLKDYWGDGSKFGLKIDYSEEETPLGRGGGIKQAMGLLERDWGCVFASNGDNLWRLDLADLSAKHQSSGALVTIVGAPFVSPYGIIEANDRSQVVGYREKPTLPYFVNAGSYIFSQGAKALLPDVGDQETETFPKLKPDQFYLYQSQLYWKGVDTMKDLSEAEKAVPEIFKELLSLG